MQFTCLTCGKDSRFIEMNQVHYPRESWVGESDSADNERTYRCEHCEEKSDLKRSRSEWREVDATFRAG